MRIWITRAAIGLLAIGLGSTYAAAQAPNSRTVRANERPALSPYLDLLRRDRGGFSSEYFREVRPRFQLRNAIGQGVRGREAIRRDQARTQQELGSLRRSLTSQLGGTGHTTGFMTHSRYFGTGQR